MVLFHSEPVGEFGNLKSLLFSKVIAIFSPVKISMVPACDEDLKTVVDSHIFLCTSALPGKKFICRMCNIDVARH